MKHAMSAVVALVLGFGLATAAQAHGMYRQSAAAPTNTQAAAPGQMQQQFRTSRNMSRQQIKQIQKQLRAEGLYRGRINGIMNRQTRLAWSRFEQQNAGARFARLTHPRRHLPKGQNVGVGSTMPKNQNAISGSTQPQNQQITPPATQAPSAGTSDNTNLNH